MILFFLDFFPDTFPVLKEEVFFFEQEINLSSFKTLNSLFLDFQKAYNEVFLA